MTRKRKNVEYYAAKAKKRWASQNTDIVIAEDRINAVCENVPIDELSSRLNHNLRLEKKSLIYDEKLCDVRDNQCSEYAIIDISLLKSMFCGVVCGKCFSSALDVHLSGANSGFAKQINVICANCMDLGNDQVISSTYTSKKVINDEKNRKNLGFFDVNVRLAMAFLQIGRNYAGIEQFSMIMNMLPFSKSSFVEYTKHVRFSTANRIESILGEACTVVKDTYTMHPTNQSNSDECVNITVSYDGTWLTRGHTSKFGISCVIDVTTGYVIDYEVMSKYCHTCVMAREDLGEDSPEFHIWMGGHKSECDMNHSGSSGSMEMAAAEILWRRSENRGLRYTTLLSDGDSKTFHHLQELQIYGPELHIEKEECVNHVAKRVGTALREEVKKCQTLKITLGGRAYGALTGSTIVKLTNYYKCAIYRNKGDVQSMKREIMAALYHGVSNDAEPQHHFCPQGASSWCFYQKAVAENRKPGLHAKNIKTPLNQTVFTHILPIYQRLTDDELLRRCAQCRTQNANESLHSLIWHKCPKEAFVSKRRIEIAAAEAIAEYNKGCSITCTEMQQAIGLPVGTATIQIAEQRDRRRLCGTKKRAATTFQKVRSAKKRGARQEEDRLIAQEGQSYKAGGF